MGNLFTVVDENDNIVGYKSSKKDIDPKTEYYRVSALRLTNSKGEILIAQRSFTKLHNPGKRGPAVAGTVEKGESYEDNIKKETEEEIGISGIQFIPGPKHKIERERHYFGQRFFATIDKNISEFNFPKDEVANIERISPEKLKKDVKLHPEKYLKSMNDYIKEFTK